ncbi:MAG: hypothetical protein C4294_14790 [Nitrospiraceae bacterium]
MTNIHISFLLFFLILGSSSIHGDAVPPGDAIRVAQLSNQMSNLQDTRNLQDAGRQDTRQSAGRLTMPGFQESTGRPESRFSNNQSLGHASNQQDIRSQDSNRQSNRQAR